MELERFTGSRMLSTSPVFSERDAQIQRERDAVAAARLGGPPLPHLRYEHRQGAAAGVGDRARVVVR